MRKSHTAVTLAALFLGPLSPALAQTADTASHLSVTGASTNDESRPSGDYSFGMRVGGYGFRQPEGDRRNGWNDCRMNGIGAFAERMLSRHAFVEAGADLYFSETFPMAPDGQEHMDRMSGLLTAAGGLRMYPKARVSAYVQLGAGLELTRVSRIESDHRHSQNHALPMGFVGVGGDIKVTRRLRAGMNLRAYVMGHFHHEHGAAPSVQPVAKSDISLDDSPAERMTAEPEAAAQAQFYLRYTL